jgi:hypothetical protein
MRGIYYFLFKLILFLVFCFINAGIPWFTKVICSWKWFIRWKFIN